MRLPVPLVLALVTTAGCHPLSCFIPKDLPKDPPLQVVSRNTQFPGAPVDVLVDDLGVPHIYAANEADVMYGLGVMHARNRLFQMLAYKHAGEGRLTELLGPDYLEVDRKNRVLMTGVPEQLAALTDRDRAMLESYCAGVNEGARQAGRSAEMAILGVDFGTFTPTDAVAITRLQQWDQSVGLYEELDRFRVVQTLGVDSDVTHTLLSDVPSGGVPIVQPDEFDGEVRPDVAALRRGATAPGPTAAAPSTQATHAPFTAAGAMLAAVKADIAARFAGRPAGASNSWSVRGEHTAAGVAVMANDPHLGHSAPGIFYMAHLETPDFAAAGGTFPGIPAVLIGHGRHIAWGITNAYADTMDLVQMKPWEGREDLYSLDGAPHAYTLKEQRFKLGTGDDAEVKVEQWEQSVFGPVLPPRWESYQADSGIVPVGVKLSLMWTAAHYPTVNNSLLSAFVDLASAETIDAATTAVQKFASPAMSINIAMTDGTIAYRLGGIVPVRLDDARADYPRDGSTTQGGWGDPLPAAQKPQTTNPAKGYIVASNQRVVDNGVLTQRYVGFEGAQPWRALRITERLQELLKDNKRASTDDLLAIQQDSTSLASKEIAPILGRHCPSKTHAPVAGHSAELVASFCDAIAGFDGNYTVDSTAIPFVRTMMALTTVAFEAHLDPRLAGDLGGDTYAQMALHNAIKAADAGDAVALFDDPQTSGKRETLDDMMGVAVARALDIVVSEAGSNPSDWRWGNLHKLSLRGTLASAPVIGGLFQTAAREEAGLSTAPRAESASAGNKLQVRFGAGLRIIAEMSDPPMVRLVNDSGQSGHFGDKHLEDQYPLWHAGTPVQLMKKKSDVQAKLEGAMHVEPHGGGAAAN